MVLAFGSLRIRCVLGVGDDVVGWSGVWGGVGEEIFVGKGKKGKSEKEEKMIEEEEEIKEEKING